MTNNELLNEVDAFDKPGFRKYLRVESIKKLLDPNYIPDKSYSAYSSSRFSFNFFGYSYTDYLTDTLDKTISYTEYLSGELYTATSTNMDYSEYLSEKLNQTWK